MTSANVQGEADFGKGEPLVIRIAEPQQTISTAGSTCLAAVMAVMVIAWSICNRPAQSGAAPMSPGVVRTQVGSAVGAPNQLTEHGVLNSAVQDSAVVK
jgi:hypothetical protein